MGNADVCVIFNGVHAYVIYGTEYSNQQNLVSTAIEKFYVSMDKIRFDAQFPGDITSTINRIEIVEVEIDGK